MDLATNERKGLTMALYLATILLACAAAVFTVAMLSGAPDSLGDVFQPVLVRR